MHIENNFHFEIDETLTDAEKILKDYYIEHKDLGLDIAHPLSKSEKIVQHILKDYVYGSRRHFSDVLLESNFLSDGLNAVFSLHTRYIPATLHRHTFYEVSFLLKGSCCHYTGTKTLPLNQGDIIIIAPNTEHAVSIFSDDCILLNLLLGKHAFEQNFLSILSQRDILANFFTKALYENRTNTFLLFHTHDDASVRNAFIHGYSVFLSQRHSRYQNQLLNSMISVFFIQLLNRHEKDVVIFDDHGSATDENIIFILRYIQEHFQTVSLSELSKFFGYSERQLRRILMEHTGMGFTDIAQQLKMQQAQNLLLHTAHTVSNIASIVGYSDPSYFRRAFKKHFGISPSEYAAKHKAP